MGTMSATDAKNKFGQLLEMARTEPVRIQKNGRDVGVLVSPEQFAAMEKQSAGPKVRPAIEDLMQRSMSRRKSLYEALAK